LVQAVVDESAKIGLLVLISLFHVN